MKVEIMEIGPNSRDTCVIVGAGEINKGSFGFSVPYNTNKKTIGKIIFSPRRITSLAAISDAIEWEIKKKHCLFPVYFV